MGEGDPVLDALYEELDETGRKTRADRRKRRQLEREIRKIRAGRLGGIKGLFRNLLQRKYPVPASATAAASTLGLGEAFAPTLGTAISEAVAEVPQTVAVPELEEIEVTAERKPEMIEAEPQFDIRSKLGSNQIRSIERRRRKMAASPDAFRPDYAIDLLPDWMKDEYRGELLDFAATFSPYESQRASLTFDPYGRRTTPAGQYAHGGILSGQADMLSRAGRGDDTMLMHVTPEEVQGLASLAPGMMTINPETGLPEAGWFRNLLGTAAPFLMAMIPGIGPLAAGALGGATGSLIKGGDLKDAMLGGITGLAGGALMKGLSGAGADVIAGEAATGALASPEAFGQAMQGVGPEGFADIAVKSGVDANAFQQAVSGGMNPSDYLSTVATPTQIGTFQQSLTDVAREALPDTFAQNFRNIGAGGLGGLKDAMFTPAGLGYISGTGLQAQHEGQQAFEDYLLAMEEQRKQRARDIEAYYPENFPIDALAASGGEVGGYAGGGSIYKNRYINGNWS